MLQIRILKLLPVRSFYSFSDKVFSEYCVQGYLYIIKSAPVTGLIDFPCLVLNHNSNQGTKLDINLLVVIT